MVPGKRLEGMALPALSLLEAIRYDMKDEIDIRLISVSNEEKLSLYLHDGRSADISWPGMLEGGTMSKLNMYPRLGQLVRALKHSGPVHLDSTFDDRIIGRSASLQ